MARPVHLYVSSSPELAAEREVLGRIAAGLPIGVGWEIKHTPGPYDDAGAALDRVADCDLFILILGADFAAPMGREWQLARDAGVLVAAYRKLTMPSPSAKAMLRESRLDWSKFADTSEFEVRLRSDLPRRILDQGERFGLLLDEVEALLVELGENDEDDAPEPDSRWGAERGGVILGRGV